MLSAGQIQRGVDWLMYHGSAGVKFRTARDLLGWKGKRLEALHVELTNSPQAQVVFAKQKPDGSWFCGGPWSSAPQYEPKSGYSAFAPKYVTAVWILSILGDMGLDLCDEPVRRGCDYVMGHQMPSGRFGRFRAPQARTEEAATAANMPCELGIYLMALGKVGMGQDPRLDKSYDLLAGWQREDGGWVNDCHKEKFGWTRSCPWSTHHGMMALSYSRRPAYTESVRRGLEFQVWHLGTKAPAQLRQFYYHGHDMIRELVMLSELRVGLKTEPVQSLLAWLAGMYQAEEGVFRYQGKPISKFNWKTDGVSPTVLRYRTYQVIEDDWLTYYGIRIARNLAN